MAAAAKINLLQGNNFYLMLRRIISEREEELPVLVIGKLLRIAEEDRRIISLGPGEPDFTAPKNIIRAAKRALDRMLAIK